MIAGVLGVIAPVFLIVALGFAAIRTGYVGDATARALGAFVLKVAMPALIFRAVTAAPLGETMHAGYVLAYAAATLGVFGLAHLRARRLGGRDRTGSAVQALGAAATNSGFVGYPLASMVFGAAAAGPILAQNMMVENTLLIPLAMVLAELGQGRQSTFGAVLAGIGRSLATNPLLIALVAGIAVAASGLRLPGALSVPVDMLASVAAPVALFVVGATIAGLAPRDLPADVAWIVLGKLVLHPLAMLGALLLVPGLDPVLLAGGVLFAAAPMISIFPIIGARYGESALSAAALLAATVAAFFTLSLTIWLLAGAGLVSLG